MPREQLRFPFQVRLARLCPLQVGHMPQEDYPEVLHDCMMLWLNGSPDDW